jgi:hypothetical protein
MASADSPVSLFVINLSVLGIIFRSTMVACFNLTYKLVSLKTLDKTKNLCS